MVTKRPTNVHELQAFLFGDTAGNEGRSAAAAGLSTRLMLLQARFNACAKEAVSGNPPPEAYQDWLVQQVERLRADREELTGLHVYLNSDGVPAEIYFLPAGETDVQANRIDIPLHPSLELGLSNDFWETDALWPEEDRPRMGMSA